MKTPSILLAAALFFGISAPAGASVVFSENFNGEPLGVPSTSLAQFLIGGSVDVIGPGSGYDFYPGNGNYLDLDGTPSTPQNPAGSVTTKLAFGAGNYTLTFNLGGSTRGDVNTVRVVLGDFSTDITLGSSAGFTFQSISFTTVGGALSFTNLGQSDNLGLILDNVELSSAVPEPATWAMMLIGFAGLGVLRRRKALQAV